MNIHFKSALDQIKAEKELLTKTERFLRNELTKSENSKKNKLINRSEYFMKKNIAVAAGLAILLIGGGGGSAYAYYQTPQSYLSVDINPSVELGINAFGKVVDVEAYNNDGEKILIGIKVKGTDVTEAVNKLVSSAANNGYIAEDGSTVVSLTSETDDEKLATELETEAETGAKESLDESEKEAAINKDNVALARRYEAKSLGITPGKLNLINKLQVVDPTATVEQYKNASVKEIMKAIKAIKHNNKVSDENQNETTAQDQSEVNNETQNIDSTVTQDEKGKQSQDIETEQNQGKENDKAQGKDNDKEQVEESNKNQGNVSNNSTNTNSNSKNTNNSDNGKSSNKGR